MITYSMSNHKARLLLRKMYHHKSIRRNESESAHTHSSGHETLFPCVFIKSLPQNINP